VTRRTRLPLRYVGSRLVLSDDTAWAWFAVPTVSYEFLSEAERDGLLAATVTALAGLSGAECHLLVVPERYDPLDWARQLDGATVSPAPGWRPYLDQLVTHLSGSEFSRRRVFLGVALGRRPRARKGRASDRLHQAAGLEDPTVSRRELRRWQAAADALEQALAASALQARGASVDELRWLVQRAFWRGLDEPPPAADPARPWGRGEVAALAESTLHNGYRSLALEQAPGTGHVAFLATARLPDVMVHPGAEWLYHTDVLDFGVEISVRFRLVPPARASSDAAKKLAEASDQARHIARTSTDVPLALAEATEQARLLEYAVTKEGLPLVYGWPRFVVAAGSPGELDSRVDALVAAYRDMGIQLARPAGDQLSLFMETLPGDQLRVAAYEQRQALVTLAGGMFTATTDLGDHCGPYLGETTGRTRAPVHFDPLAAARRNLPTAVAVTGAPGGGKTHLAELLLYQLALRGAWGLMVDPKNEAGGFARLPDLPNVKVVTLDDDHRGLLDPFKLATTRAEASLLAVDVLRLLLPPGLGPEHEAALLDACRREGEVKRPCLSGAVARLAKSAVGAPLAETLRTVATLPLAALCFEGEGATPLPTDGHVLVVQTQGLILPDAGTQPAEFTVADRFAVTVMYLVTSLAARLADAAPAQAKVIVLDEAWALTASRQGRALVQRLARTGRSKNTALVLVSQNAADFLGPEVQNNFSAKFAFRSTQDDEVQAVLKLLGVDPSEEHSRALRTLANGECVFADVEGRLGTVQIDLVLPLLADAFNTTPGVHQRRTPERVG
jgi:hypothetical protein